MKMYTDFTIQQSKNEPIAAGKYGAKVVGVELEEGGKFGDQVKVQFRIPAGDDHPDKDIYGWASKKFTPSCKLYRWTQAILGPISEDYYFRPGDILEKWCFLMILEETGEKGVFNKIADVMPYKKPKTQAPPPPPADADF
jgi:hypothetical protein